MGRIVDKIQDTLERKYLKLSGYNALMEAYGIKAFLSKTGQWPVECHMELNGHSGVL